MAEIKPPKKNNKGAPPPETNPSTNLEKTGDGLNVPMNFSVPKEFKKEFKIRAFEEEIAMVDLLKKCFEYYKTNVK